MKNVFTNTMIFAAAAIAFGMTASAQPINQFKAEIPFDFQVGNQKYAAGTYRGSVSSMNGGARVLFLAESAANKKRMMISNGVVNAATSTETAAQPRMLFRCGDAGCSLVQVWPGNGSGGMLFLAPQSKSGPQHLTVIRLQTANAD